MLGVSDDTETRRVAGAGSATGKAFKHRKDVIQGRQRSKEGVDNDATKTKGETTSQKAKRTAASSVPRLTICPTLRRGRPASRRASAQSRGPGAVDGGGGDGRVSGQAGHGHGVRVWRRLGRAAYQDDFRLVQLLLHAHHTVGLCGVLVLDQGVLELRERCVPGGGNEQQVRWWMSSR